MLKPLCGILMLPVKLRLYQPLNYSCVAESTALPASGKHKLVHVALIRSAKQVEQHNVTSLLSSVCLLEARNTAAESIKGIHHQLTYKPWERQHGAINSSTWKSLAQGLLNTCIFHPWRQQAKR